MYTGYLLTEKTRNELLAQFPPKYVRFIGHHVTEQFGVKKSHPAPAQPESVVVVGYIDSGDGVEGFLVEVNGTTERPDGSRYHVTWSIAENRKPVETNNYTGMASALDPIVLDVEAKNFSQSG